MSDQSHPPVILKVSPAGVAVVLINRPQVKNAFDEATIEALHEAFETLRGSTARVVILRGADGVFCAGADIGWMRRQAEHDLDQNEADALELAEMLRALYELPQVTIAAVEKAAMGGGAGLVAACDVAVATQDTRFRFSEVRLGLTPATISPYVVEAIGPRMAKALFVTAELFDAAYAERIGLVQYVVSDTQALEAQLEALTTLALEAAPEAVADAKHLVRDVTGDAIDHGLSVKTSKRIAARRASDEGREGLSAFLEKRSPDWVS